MNSSKFENGSSALSLDELLKNLGFELWEEIVNKFLLPFLNFWSIWLCSLSIWIFSKKKIFSDPVFVYYRLISFLYILCSVINIPFGLCFTPRFYPPYMINTFACSVYYVIYTGLSIFFFHYCSVLEMCILLTRMKILDPFVKKHFSLSPHYISLILFFVCLVLNILTYFLFKIGSLGDYYYMDSEDGSMHIASLYYYTTSDFATSHWGEFAMVLSLIVTILFTLIVAVVLNIVSFWKYKMYLRNKREREQDIRMRSISRNQQATTSNKTRNETQKERYERKAENNMFYMAFTLSSISIVYRFNLIVGYVIFFVYHSFSNSLILLSFGPFDINISFLFL